MEDFRRRGTRSVAGRPACCWWGACMHRVMALACRIKRMVAQRNEATVPLLGQGPDAAPSPTYRSEHPLIDPGPLEMLKNAGAPHHTLVGLGERFSATLQTQLDALMERLQALLAAAAALPKQELVDAAHRMRSACLTIGAVALADEMKQWSRHDGVAAAAAHGQRVRQAFHATHDALATLLQTMKPL